MRSHSAEEETEAQRKGAFGALFLQLAGDGATRGQLTCRDGVWFHSRPASQTSLPPGEAPCP